MTSETPAVKKGNQSWKPAERMSMVKKKPGLEHRWCDGDPASIARHEANGWVPVSKINGNQADTEKQSTSVTEYRGMVLCTIPTEDYQTHRDYYAEQTKKQLSGLKRRVQKESADAAQGKTPAPIHGSIVIS